MFCCLHPPLVACTTPFVDSRHHARLPLTPAPAGRGKCPRALFDLSRPTQRRTEGLFTLSAPAFPFFLLLCLSVLKIRGGVVAMIEGREEEEVETYKVM